MCDTMYKLMKVFNCEDLPEKLFFPFLDFYECKNGSHVKWTIGRHTDENGKLIDQWLIETGATENETVIFSYGW